MVLFIGNFQVPSSYSYTGEVLSYDHYNVCSDNYSNGEVFYYCECKECAEFCFCMDACNLNPNKSLIKNMYDGVFYEFYDEQYNCIF